MSSFLISSVPSYGSAPSYSAPYVPAARAYDIPYLSAFIPLFPLTIPENFLTVLVNGGGYALIEIIPYFLLILIAIFAFFSLLALPIVVIALAVDGAIGVGISKPLPYKTPVTY